MDETNGNEVQGGKLEGIGGWLILVAIGLMITPVRIAYGLMDVFPAFTGSAWERLTTVGSPAYHYLWAPLLITEMVGNIIFIIFSLVNLFFFFKKKKLLPVLMIVFLLSNFVFVAADYYLAMKIPIVAAMPDESMPSEIIRLAVTCVIWVPYFLKSKRVKNTFVK